MNWPSITATPLMVAPLTAAATSIEVTSSNAAVMASMFSCHGVSGLKANKAVTPWGTLLVDTTWTEESEAAACSAAKTTLPLLGRTITSNAPVAWAASNICCTLGFMVCPPSTTPGQPESKNKRNNPSPSATGSKASLTLSDGRTWPFDANSAF